MSSKDKNWYQFNVQQKGKGLVYHGISIVGYYHSLKKLWTGNTYKVKINQMENFIHYDFNYIQICAYGLKANGQKRDLLG